MITIVILVVIIIVIMSARLIIIVIVTGIKIVENDHHRTSTSTRASTCTSTSTSTSTSASASTSAVTGTVIVIATCLCELVGGGVLPFWCKDCTLQPCFATNCARKPSYKTLLSRARLLARLRGLLHRRWLSPLPRLWTHGAAASLALGRFRR